MDKVHFNQGDYVEKLCSCKISTLVFINVKHTLRIIIDMPSYVVLTGNSMLLFLYLGCVIIR